MHVREILMRCFMSHTKTDLKLPEKGLVVVTGPNGSGKSSLVEGVAFGGWGESLRGTPPWGESPGELVVAGDVVRVERSCKSGKKKMSWSRNGEAPVKYESTTKAEEALEAVIGPFDVWRRTHVFSSHDAAHFTMASDGERKRLLECILGLHRFDEALEQCRADRRKEELEQASAATRVQQRQAQLSSARERLADAEKVWAAAPTEVNGEALSKKMADLDEKIDQSSGDYHAATEQVNALVRVLATCEFQVQKCERQREFLEEEKKNLAGRLANRVQLEAAAKDAETLKGLLDAMDTQILELRQKRDAQSMAAMKWREQANTVKLAHEHAQRALEAAQKTSERLGQVPCGGQGAFSKCQLIAGAIDAKAEVPMWMRAVEDATAAMGALGEAPVVDDLDEDGWASRRRDLVRQISAASSALVELAAMKEVAARVKAVDDELILGSQTAQEKRKEGVELEERVALQKSLLEELQDECNALRQQKAEVEASLRVVEQGARQRQAAQDGVQRATVALAAVGADLAKDESVAAESYRRLRVLEAVEQVLGLKGVRAHVLGRALSGIEQAANSWLLRFGLSMSLELKSYTEKKTGGVSDAISLVVNGAGGGYGYRGASGGQRRRIDVALLLALADVASAAQGRSPGTLFLDEIFDALDEDGVDSIVSVLDGLAAERAVVVITHNQDLIRKMRPVLRLHVSAGAVQSV